MTLLRQHLGLIVLAIAVLLSTIIYSCSTRYYVQRNVVVFDRWTGKVTVVTPARSDSPTP